MIVLPRDTRILLITQLEHADLSGQIAALWGNTNFSKPEPFGAMVTAAGNHDSGWWEWDTHPTVNPRNGLPYTFTELPVLEWLRMYKRGIERVAQCDPYEGLMVAMHGVGLRKNRYGTVPVTDRRDNLTPAEKRAVSEFIESGEELQAKLRRRIRTNRQYKNHASEKHVFANYELIQVWDRLSLYLCSGGQSGGIKEGILGPSPSIYGEDDIQLHLEKRKDDIVISPFPLRLPARVSIRGRFIPNKQYRSDEELRRSYYAAESITMTFNIVKE